MKKASLAELACISADDLQGGDSVSTPNSLELEHQYYGSDELSYGTVGMTQKEVLTIAQY